MDPVDQDPDSDPDAQHCFLAFGCRTTILPQFELFTIAFSRFSFNVADPIVYHGSCFFRPGSRISDPRIQQQKIDGENFVYVFVDKNFFLIWLGVPGSRSRKKLLPDPAIEKASVPGSITLAKI